MKSLGKGECELALLPVLIVIAFCKVKWAAGKMFDARASAHFGVNAAP